MRTIDVNLPDRPYTILIESGLLARVGEMVRAVVPHERALLAVDRNITATHGSQVAMALDAAGYEVEMVEIEALESAKTLESAHDLYDAMLAARLERGSPVIALGGGIVGDVAGFVAATYLRGVPVIQVPTTLLAMVDASIGGKTGVNHPLPKGGGLGKNLIGAFWQPRAVLVDPQTLGTLDARDFRCGLAECVKHGMIADADLFAHIETNADAIGRLDPDVLEELIERCARIKVGIVVADEREAGQRALLNLGHTFAHAIESIPELDRRHGEAVAIGLHGAMLAALATGRVEVAQVSRVTSLLEALGLPSSLSRIPVERLIRAMGFDKKVSGGQLKFILPIGIGDAEIVADVSEDVIREAWTGLMAD